MKTQLVILSILCSIILKSPINERKTVSEDFKSFFNRFCSDEKFQVSRVSFPLLYVHPNENDVLSSDTTLLNKEDWKFETFYSLFDAEILPQLYDNFNHKLADTDERVFALYGEGNGIKIFYYFKRKSGKWYLIKKEDLSI